MGNVLVPAVEASYAEFLYKVSMCLSHPSSSHRNDTDFAEVICPPSLDLTL